MRLRSEEEQAGEDDIDPFVGAQAGGKERAEGLVEIGEKDEVEDVDAIAVLAEPPHGTDGTDVRDEVWLKGQGDDADSAERDG